MKFEAGRANCEVPCHAGHDCVIVEWREGQGGPLLVITRVQAKHYDPAGNRIRGPERTRGLDKQVTAHHESANVLQPYFSTVSQPPSRPLSVRRVCVIVWTRLDGDRRMLSLFDSPITRGWARPTVHRGAQALNPHT